jgi:D-alanyl-D-alanine carboxypeptidase/D-alanyl-D-alanine-endopeptidase (penicillin-binding protein 4)
MIAAAMLVFKAEAADFPKTVADALHRAGIPESSVGVWVQELGAPQPRLNLNADKALNPASTMKIVTTYAALELLGPAYRWKTEVYQDGNDLVLKGYGDPKLNQESFWMLLRALRGRGLRELRGDVVLDRSFFAPAQLAAFDSDTFRPYNVTPDPLLVNFRSVRFVFVTEAERVRVFAEPSMPGLEIVNSLRPAGGPCPDGTRAFRETVGASFQSRPPRASFTGVYPTACAERELNVALHDPQDYFAGILRQLWSEMGGSWTGSLREGTASSAARLVYVHESESLSEAVRDINKYSNNVMARQLFLTLAAEVAGPPARADEAAKVVKQWLASKKISAPELMLENGSGLSRVERISAAHLGALLASAWRSPVMPELMASLPLVAADGTMRKRLVGQRVAGNAHIKTGLLSDARAIAGFVLDRNGKRQAVVMLINHPRAHEGEAAADALLEWTYDATGPARPITNRPGGAPARP